MTRAIFATLDTDLAPVEVSAVQCRTFWQKVANQEEAGLFGVAVGEYARVEVQHPSLAEYDAAARERFRLFVVEVADDPAGGALIDLGLSFDGETVIAMPTYAERTPEEIVALRTSKVAEVKSEANRRILEIMPEVQQRNALALGMEMVTLHGANVSAWPSEDQAIHGAVMAKWAQIKAIRAASDAIEEALPQDAAGLIAFDAATADGWPA